MLNSAPINTSIAIGHAPAMDPETIKRRRVWCGILSVASLLIGISIIILGFVFSTYYLMGPGATVIVWAVIAGTASCRYGHASRVPANQTQCGISRVQTNNIVLPEYLQQQTGSATYHNQGFGANTYAQAQPEGTVQTQPYPGQFSAQYSSPPDYSFGNATAPPPSYEVSTGGQFDKM